MMQLGIFIPCLLNVQLKLFYLSLQMCDLFLVLVVLVGEHIEFMFEVSYLCIQFYFLLLENFLDPLELTLVYLGWIIHLVSSKQSDVFPQLIVTLSQLL